MDKLHESHDHPCTIIDNISHITVTATKTVCGMDWKYQPEPERFKRTLITKLRWLSPDKITCQKCIEIYNAN